MNNKTSSCKGTHWPDWVGTSGRRGLFTIREKPFSWETHDEEISEKLLTADWAVRRNETEAQDLELSGAPSMRAK